MAQVQARIVVAQAGNPAPGGYSYGPRDNLVLGSQITLTNQSNTDVTSHTWEVVPAVGQTLSAYNVAGSESPSCTLTPPASTGYGDVYVRLTVRGDPLPDGKPNVHTDQVLLGIRAPLVGYGAGVPIPHPRESLFGGIVTLDAARGALGRLSEGLLGLLQGGGGGGGGGASAPEVRIYGFAGKAETTSATWITIGALDIDPSTLGEIAYFTFATVTDADAGAYAQVRLIAEDGIVGDQHVGYTGGTSGAAWPEAWDTPDRTVGEGDPTFIKPTKTTYLVQLCRGGSAANVRCYGAYVRVRYTP